MVDSSEGHFRRRQAALPCVSLAVQFSRSPNRCQLPGPVASVLRWTAPLSVRATITKVVTTNRLRHHPRQARVVRNIMSDLRSGAEQRSTEASSGGGGPPKWRCPTRLRLKTLIRTARGLRRARSFTPRRWRVSYDDCDAARPGHNLFPARSMSPARGSGSELHPPTRYLCGSHQKGHHSAVCLKSR